jgi:hydrogenase maturation protein HypF
MGADAFKETRLQPVASFSPDGLRALGSMLDAGTCPVTSSAGRLFDAVASLCGLCQVANFDGQPAMLLEYALLGTTTGEQYEFELLATRGADDFRLVVDWGPLIRGVIDDVKADVAPGMISARFHNSLVEIIAAVAHRIGDERVVLTGGCFQNKYLIERAVARLREEGFRPYWHQRVPTGDGGLALGQVVAARRALQCQE